ncbi:MAG: diguanylate cyclase [Chromatiaceae bacterium]|nr:diguanylate cyclase [Chromatiaceae bacterium]
MTADARILIVDDDPAAIEILEQALAGLGEVCFATGGADALALLARDPVDLVLLDANMPDLDGFATCHILKQEYPDLPVIFVTAYSEEGREIRALEAGAVDFIHKPIRPTLVRARVAVNLKLGALTAELRASSDRDPLTGIPNRRVLDDRLAREWGRAAREQQPLGLLMIDIDHFKDYNDHFGHLQGDDCLCRVARALVATVQRTSDLVARYGGEEFMVLSPGSHLEACAALGEKIRAAIRALAIPQADTAGAAPLTVSIGVASGVPSPAPAGPDARTHPRYLAGDTSGLTSVAALVAQADRALYVAKTRGRDRVCTSEA